MFIGMLPLFTSISSFTAEITNLSSVKTTSADPKRIHIIFATGGLGDKSFNDAGFRGYEAANATSWASDFTLDYVEPETVPEFADFQKAAATKTEKYDLIIAVGFLQLTSLNKTARDYPDQNFTLIDDELTLPNVRSVLFKEEESAFLVGAMAAMVTQTNKIGFLGGLELFLILKFLAGYEQGAHYINPDINVTAMFSPNPTNPWGDIAGGKNVGKALLNAGNDVIFAAAGGTGIGVFQAVNETDDAYAIGVDSDQDGEAKGKILCSMLKKVEAAVFNSIRDTVFENFTAGTSTLGLAEGGVDISPMTYTQSIANGNFEVNGVTKTRWEHVQDIKAKIINGTFQSISTAPDWDKIAKDQLATPGFEVFWTIVFLLGFAVIMRKRSRR